MCPGVGQGRDRNGPRTRTRVETEACPSTRTRIETDECPGVGQGRGRNSPGTRTRVETEACPGTRARVKIDVCSGVRTMVEIEVCPGARRRVKTKVCQGGPKRYEGQMALRWGIITAGKISHDFVNAFNSYPDKGDQVIAAVAARSATKASEFAKLHNIPKVFESYHAMVVTNEIDIVYIGALNPDHYGLAKMCLENGKHVLCEKPLCLNYKQTESIIRLAKKTNLFLMEAVWSRFSPIYLALEKEINSGKLGDVHYVEVNFGSPISAVQRVCMKDLGGSAVLDIGIYTLQFAQFIFKEEPTKVTAIGELNEDGVDLVDTVVLDYAGGKKAVLNINSKVRLINNATVYGNKGRATIEDPFHFPTSMIHADGSTEKIPLHTSPIPYNFENSAGLVFQALEVARCIKQGLKASPRMPHKESLTLAKLEDEIRRQVGVKFDVDSEEYP
ncbi:unnamed protein product, partial [Iphiclides podalirius]